MTKLILAVAILGVACSLRAEQAVQSETGSLEKADKNFLAGLEAAQPPPATPAVVIGPARDPGAPPVAKPATAPLPPSPAPIATAPPTIPAPIAVVSSPAVAVAPPAAKLAPSPKPVREASKPRDTDSVTNMPVKENARTVSRAVTSGRNSTPAGSAVPAPSVDVVRKKTSTARANPKVPRVSSKPVDSQPINARAVEAAAPTRTVVTTTTTRRVDAGGRHIVSVPERRSTVTYRGFAVEPPTVVGTVARKPAQSKPAPRGFAPRAFKAPDDDDDEDEDDDDEKDAEDEDDEDDD